MHENAIENYTTKLITIIENIEPPDFNKGFNISFKSNVGFGFNAENHSNYLKLKNNLLEKEKWSDKYSDKHLDGKLKDIIAFARKE
jgi:hypothetical protein